MVWGSSYFAVKQQVGVVALDVSLLYRLALADIIFFALVWLMRRWQPLGFRDHLALAAFGFGNFAGSYGLLYFATEHLTSGYVTLLFSTKVLLTPLCVSVVLQRPLDRKVLVGGSLGLLGAGLILLPQLSGGSGPSLWAVVVALFGTFVAALGDVASARSSSAGVDPLQANALGIFYGLLPLMGFIIIYRRPLVLDPSPRYWAALLWLTLAASVLAWLFYLKLVQRLGPGKAGYMVALFPLVGVGASLAFEGLELTPNLAIGMGFALVGNAIALRQ